MRKLFMIAMAAVFSVAMVSTGFAQAPATEKKAEDKAEKKMDKAADKAEKKMDKAEKKADKKDAANPCAAKAAEKK